jgi:CRISPR-associated helicase Cas3
MFMFQGVFCNEWRLDMQIKRYNLPRVRHPFYEQRKQSYPDCEVAQSGWHPYIHQAALFDGWHKHEAFLLTTKTGSGKTQASALPVIANGESAFFVYPTNALIEDQERSIRELAEGMGWRAYSYAAGEAFDKRAFNRADVILFRIDADNLEKIRREKRHRTKGQTLQYLLNANSGKPTIVLTNPDTLFLILTLRYGQGMAVFQSLRQYQTLVVDEFHLYDGVELAHLLFMLHYCRAQGFFGGRFVLLSATPDEDVSTLLDQVIAPHRVPVKGDLSYPSVKERSVAYPVELYPVSPGEEPVETALQKFEALRPELERLFSQNTADDYVPLVIIFNSVMAAMYAADLLREHHQVPADQIGEYRGLMDRQLRSFRNKLVVVGTSAIEVGVDFKCRYLIFEAGDVAAFMQRFGRIGRHEVGTAYLLAPPNVLEADGGITGPMSRDKLEEHARRWYAKNDARPWFAQTESGVYTVALLAQKMVDTIAADPAATEEVINDAQARVDALLANYTTRIGAQSAYKRAYKCLRLYKRNPEHDAWAWLDAYEQQMAFRTSSVNFRVHDIREEQRREGTGGWYDVDLRTLLRRGKNLYRKKGRNGNEYVTIYGYTKAARVDAYALNITLGDLHSTQRKPVMLMCEGKNTHLSDVMKRENHLFVVVPESVRLAIDWRIPIYYHPQGLLAFDGAALLLKEIYQREKTKSPR